MKKWQGPRFCKESLNELELICCGRAYRKDSLIGTKELQPTGGSHGETKFILHKENFVSELFIHEFL